MASTDVSLHVFGDASTSGYGAVCYRRAVAPSGEVHIAFLCSASHVVPLNAARASHHCSVPRLEMVAAAKAVEKRQFVERSVGKFEKVYHWCDNLPVIKQIRDKTTKFRVFVANRLSKIHAASKMEEWRFVDGELNPADHCSRGLKADEYAKWKVFREGPEFLYKSEEFWPKEPSPAKMALVDISANAIQEIKMDFSLASMKNIYDIAESVENWWTKMRKVVMLLRCVKRWKQKTKAPKRLRLQRTGVTWNVAPTATPLLDVTARISAEDFAMARKYIFLAVQRKHFAEELQCLVDGKIAEADSRRSKETRKQFLRSQLKDFNPFVDSNGLIRIGSRLLNAPVDEDVKLPIIIPRKDPIVRMWLRHIHISEIHAGPKHCIAQAREQAWVIHGLQEMKIIVRRCVACQKAFKPPLEQQMAPLPLSRLTLKSPFKETGLDLMGPFFVRMNGRANHKVWVTVFTCLASRSVHCEVVFKMDADSLLNAIVRFSARRPGTTYFVSDNGTNLTKAEKVLKRDLKQWNDSSAQHLQRKGLTWDFIPAGTPHRGGVWERVVGMFKRHLTTLMLGDAIHVETFMTVVTQVEAIINRRPLSTLSSSADDCETFTPAHILYPAFSSHDSCVVSTEQTMSTATELKGKFYQAQGRINAFKKMWERDYFQTLHFRQKWKNTHVDLKERQIVMLVDDQQPRSRWRLARVVEAIRSNNHVKAARVRTTDGKLWLKDRSKLVVLELDIEAEVEKNS